MKYPTNWKSGRAGGTSLIGLLAVGLIVVIAFVYLQAHPGILGGTPGQNVITTTTTSGQTGSGNVVTFINFLDVDPGAQSDISSATISVYPAAGVVIGGQSYSGAQLSETITSSTSAVKSGDQYPAGATLFLKVAKANYVTEYDQVVVPAPTANQIQGGLPVSLTVYQPLLGTASVVVANNLGYTLTSNSSSTGWGTTYTNAHDAAMGHYNYTTAGTSSVTFTITLYNTAANSGWADSYDPINLQNWNLVSQLSTTGTSVAVSGITQSRAVGSSTYWFQQMNSGYDSTSGLACSETGANCVSNSGVSGGWTQFTVGQTVYGGSTSYSISVNKGSLAHGSTQELVIQFYDYSSVSWFIANGNYGANSATLGSAFDFWLGA